MTQSKTSAKGDPKSTTKVATKGERTREKILKSSIQCLATLGYEKTTFQAIADHCGISQPLVVHYFEKRENVFPSVIEYLITRTQDVIRKEIDHTRSAVDRLNDFIRISLEYVRKEPAEAKVFLTLSLFATFNDQYRSFNAKIKQSAIHELTEILDAGIKTHEFKVTDTSMTAKMIASYIMGVRMNLLNEKPVIPDAKIIRSTQEHCLAILNLE